MDKEILTMFTTLLKDSPALQDAYNSKRNAIFTRAFWLGEKHFTSKEFKQEFSVYKAIIPQLNEPPIVKKLIAELEASEESVGNYPVVVSGILTDMTGLSEAFDEIGIHIVADDVCAHSRQYRTDVPDGDDPLQALAVKFANTDNCSVLYNVEKPRIQWIIDIAKERGAKGVVVVMTKFCDPEEFDFVCIKEACEKADLPLALVEVDRQMKQFEQVKTNLETFRDMLMF